MRSATLLALLPMALAAPYTHAKRDHPAPVIVPRGGTHIENKFIVRMKKDTISTAVSSAISSIKSDADYTYTRGFNGFAATLDNDELENLRNDVNVSHLTLSLHHIPY